MVTGTVVESMKDLEEKAVTDTLLLENLPAVRHPQLQRHLLVAVAVEQVGLLAAEVEVMAALLVAVAFTQQVEAVAVQ
jgi:hypothetical protein